MFVKAIQNNLKQRNMRLVINYKTRNELASSLSFKYIKHTSYNSHIFELSKSEIEIYIFICIGQ